MCERDGRVTAASVVDHITPHRGDPALFWQAGNHQSLCASCHNSRKQAEESRGYQSDIGTDGWPMDAKHPVHSGRQAKP
jgi:5-methylcytosine-specific restriction enzyme A